MKINLDSVTEDIQIQILPLIDVIFCILTFFILGAVGLSRQQAINLDLPQAKTGEAQMREMFMVVVDPMGQVSLEVQPQQWRQVTQQELTAQLKGYKQINPNGLVTLYAHPNASYSQVVQVLDVLREIDSRVALATLPTNETKLPNNSGVNPLNPFPSPLSPSPGNPGTTPTTPGLLPGLSDSLPLSGSPGSPSAPTEEEPAGNIPGTSDEIDGIPEQSDTPSDAQSETSDTPTSKITIPDTPSSESGNAEQTRETVTE
ncbi:MAG TPA: biopolymer transporter ExbD [Oscillatoriales cyanobacterium M59_W2019_021]|nr:MAG: biopolymer transporter ExbD [Cyanobacteria bacterium J055]HIK31261.1 biopolymer transporter ExbD [Oscillatoriales cyanobacterium M4454_W2019_049]HIK49905.1 biopolymer transporter ExbD [Oscillatoriales cyanobacterium M59_W2019_021]